MKRATLMAAVFGLVTTALIALTGTTGASAAPAYTVQTLHFKVTTGASGATTCDIVGDLYLPATATAADRVPAILTTNGFGGSKDDQAGIGKAFATRGYAVLSYSGLGFGGSGCKITLDDPDTDGRAGSQLVSYLGGADGVAFTDAAHTVPAPVLDVITRDAKDHLGKASTNDPRVGMVGGSYGGQIQFAVASVDPRVDTIIPLITWNDLSYSLGPNNTDQVSGVTTRTPGSVKLSWGLGFTALGVVDALQNPTVNTTRLLGCPNFVAFVCTALVTGGSTGFFAPSDIRGLRHASVASYLDKITIPTLLIQGQNDTLFNLNEATATYRALKAQGTPVKMIWQSWGHSRSEPAPGEIDLANPDPSTQYETARVSDWLERYLRDRPVPTGPAFAYFRDWVDYTGIATPAYATSSTFPVGTARTMYLSGAGDLVTSPTAVRAGSQRFVTPVLGLPTSFDPLDALGSLIGGAPAIPDYDLPGTFATWKGAELSAPLDVVGSPLLTLRVNAPTVALTQVAGDLGRLVVFAKIVDIGPDGTSTIVKNLVAPVRVPDVTKPFTVTMPGIVHRFAPGHRLGLIVAGGSLNYRGNLVAAPVTIVSGAAQTLTLPVVR